MRTYLAGSSPFVAFRLSQPLSTIEGLAQLSLYAHGKPRSQGASYWEKATICS